MPDFTPEDAKQALDELGIKMKKYGEDSAEYKTALENTQKILDAQEENSQKITKEIAEERKVREEQDERIKTLELEIARGGTGEKVNYKETPEYKALTHWVAEGEKNLDADEAECLNAMQKTLRTDIDTGAGYLTMPEMDTAIVKTITEISNIRSVVRVRTTSKKVLEIPVRTGVPTATYEGEAAAGDDDESTYGNEQLTAFRLTVTVPFTQDMLMDSSFDLEAEINADVAEGMAQKEGAMMVATGTGSKQPEAFLQNAVVVAASVPSTVTDGLAAVDLTTLTGELKVGYDPMYGFNRRTLAYCRSLEDSAGGLIWQMNLADGAPNTINGEPYIILPDMPDLAGGALSVVYADFLRGYTITDRTGLMIVRDPYAKKRQAIIEITFSKWNTGQVILPEAFVVLEIKS